MKAFVRTPEGYVWKMVPKEGLALDGVITDTDGLTYAQGDVLKILGEIRDKYEMCNNCGELFKAGEFAAHKADRIKRCNCANCNYLSRDSRRITRSNTIKMLPDGTAIQRETVSFVPRCDRSDYPTLDEAKSSGQCIFYKCSSYQRFDPDTILLLRRPNWFKHLITESSLIAHKWKLELRKSNGRIYIKNGIKCWVDPSGVVIHFRYENSPRIMYSPEYDEFAKTNGEEFDPIYGKPWSTTDEEWDKVINTIRRLRR